MALKSKIRRNFSINKEIDLKLERANELTRVTRTALVEMALEKFFEDNPHYLEGFDKLERA